jgi:hypothetical protein
MRKQKIPVSINGYKIDSTDFLNNDYIEAILLERKQIMDMHIGLLKTFPWSKVEIPSNFVNFNEAINIAPFTFFVLYTLKKALPFALQNSAQLHIRHDDCLEGKRSMCYTK